MYEIAGNIDLSVNSSITFNTTITTYSNVPAALSNIKVYNGNNEITGLTITPNLDSSNPFIRICVNNSDDLEECTINSSRSVTIEIINNTGSAIVTNNFRVVLTFTPFYQIVYNDDVIGYVLTGDTFTYQFPSNPPAAVTVDSGTYGTPQLTTSNNITTLTIANVTSNLELTGGSGMAGSGTWADPYIKTDNSYHYNDLDAASYKFVSLTGEPEITVDANHKVTKYQLTNCGTGIDLNGGTIESGLLAFDNQRITITMEFTTNFGVSSNYYKCLITALASTGTNTYSGFRVTNKKNGMMYVHTMNNQSIAANGTGGYQIIDFNLGNKYGKNSTRFSSTIIFDPSTDELSITMSPGSVSETGSITTITDAMKNATVTIGGNGINNNNDMGALTIHSLTITKG